MIVDTTNDNKNRIPVRCLCDKKIAERDNQYIYIYCKRCKRTHKYKLAE